MGLASNTPTCLARPTTRADGPAEGSGRASEVRAEALTGDPMGCVCFRLCLAAVRHAWELRDEAQAALTRSGLADTTWLARLADKVVERDS